MFALPLETKIRLQSVRLIFGINEKTRAGRQARARLVDQPGCLLSTYSFRLKAVNTSKTTPSKSRWNHRNPIFKIQCNTGLKEEKKGFAEEAVGNH